MQDTSETNKGEEATPFKLKRAREKGTVARGADLGFFSTLTALAAFALLAGTDLLARLQEGMRQFFISAPVLSDDPHAALAAGAGHFWFALQGLALLGVTLVFVVGVFEVIQLRGIVFSTHPLKPDFSRLNPAKGFKRLFSLRMLKETLKGVLKLAVYVIAAYLIAHDAFRKGQGLDDARELASAIGAGGLRLLFDFAGLALAFAALDQILARRDFRKQMRMSRSEVTREHKEREGEPRLKQKRRQLHALFAKQARELGDLRGSDMLIVNPEHYAVALNYDARTMSAPRVTAKGRNHFALMLKRRAAELSVAIIEHPPLARELYKSCDKGGEVPSANYRAVAELYLKLNASRDRPHAQS